MAILRTIPNPGESPPPAFQTPIPQQVGPVPYPTSPPFQAPMGDVMNRAGPPRPVQVPPNLPGPIYPGPGWHRGPGVSVGQENIPRRRSPFGYAGLRDDPDFNKFLKFGVVDNGILVISTLAGGGMDAYIAKTLKVPRGWGPVMGAIVGNAISDGVAGMADGMVPAAGVTVGALLPVIPVFLAASAAQRSPDDKTTQYALMGISGALVAWAFLKR